MSRSRGHYRNSNVVTRSDVCRIPRAMHIRVRVVLRIGGVGQHVIHQLAVVEDGPEGVAAAAVEDDLHGGLGDLGENGGAVAGGVCLAFVDAVDRENRGTAQ